MNQVIEPYAKDAEIFQTSRSRLQILGARRATKTSSML